MASAETAQRGSRPEAAAPKTRSLELGSPLGVLIIALGAVTTLAWVGGLVLLAWFLIHAVL